MSQGSREWFERRAVAANQAIENFNGDAEERAIAWAQDEMTRLRSLLDAAVATLQNNLHLCDGENCTLHALLKAVEAIDPKWEEQ